MTWALPSQPHRVFERNPLVAVVVELRFFTILKVPDRIADYQDRLRGTFPIFREVTQQLVKLGPAPVEVKAEKLFNFAKPDEAAVLTLSTASLSLEARRHERREHFISDAKLGLDSLAAVYGSIVINRLGLRYVNVVDRQRVEQDLQRPTSWDALLTNRFTSVPTGLADSKDTLFACEVASPMLSGGAQTVRYGLMRDVDTQVKFRLDVDRYVEGVIDPGKVVEHLHHFTDDIFAVFMSAMGPDLKAWMPERIEA